MKKMEGYSDLTDGRKVHGHRILLLEVGFGSV